MINATRIEALRVVVGLTWALQARAIRTVDFKNFEYPWDEPAGKVITWRRLGTSAQTTDRLMNGLADLNDSDDVHRSVKDMPSLRPTSVTCGTLGPHGNETAAIQLNYSSGGTANWDYLCAYELENGSPKLLGRLQSGSRTEGGLVNVATQGPALALGFADEAKRTGDCCSTGLIRIAYPLKGGQFAQSAPRTRGDFAIQNAVAW